MTLLQIQNLSVSFLGEKDEDRAVRDCSFSIEQGEIVGLVGESGCGKSTILKTIVRSLPPPGVIRGGCILFGDRDVLQLPYQDGMQLRWKDISFVVQSALNSLNPVLTIRAHFQDTLHKHTSLSNAEIQQKSLQCLEMMGLSAIVMDKYAHELSGGMRQRVVLALAFVLEPSLVIFDEPTTALDVLVEADILRQIKEVQQKLQFAALFVSHDLSMVRTFVDRIVVMKDGEVVETVRSEQLGKKEHHSYTQHLLTSQQLSRPSRKMMEQPAIVTFRSVHKVYHGTFSGDSIAVAGVSFSLHRKETVALVGGSGSGKSTIGKMVAGLENCTQGEIEWTHKNTARRWSLWRSQKPSPVQMIFQDPFGSLNSTRTIQQHLLAPLRNRGVSTVQAIQHIQEMLTKVGLEASGTQTKYPHELSGGQRQRVAIARALLSEPSVIIADEPTSMLDVSLRKDILDLLLSLQQEHDLSILFITHDLIAARYVADRIIVLEQGKIVEQGPAEEIFENPNHSYTKQLLKR